jgi:hypothetical protein
MKYKDLTAVADIDRDVMDRIAGGFLSVGDVISANVPGLGRPHTPSALASMAALAEFGVDNFGRLIQYRADQYGYPGNNGVIARVNDVFGLDVHLPPGLPPGN